MNKVCAAVFLALLAASAPTSSAEITGDAASPSLRQRELQMNDYDSFTSGATTTTTTGSLSGDAIKPAGSAANSWSGVSASVVGVVLSAAAWQAAL
ncbi:hypothetical protein PINS_up017421 [Pythium insidiosum]|nr:hypothetical protein PINS_up017421 [Pythium insidiosum]